MKLKLVKIMLMKINPNNLEKLLEMVITICLKNKDKHCIGAGFFL